MNRGCKKEAIGLPADGGAEEDRTPDPHNAIVVLYQLSYDPIRVRFVHATPFYWRPYRDSNPGYYRERVVS